MDHKIADHQDQYEQAQSLYNARNMAKRFETEEEDE